jgi:NADPH2:quinone reductase
MKAWRVHQYGSPSKALELDEVELPQPGPAQVRVRVSCTVLNFNDIDGCYGRYRTVHPEIPYTLGMEVVGTVDAVGPGAEEWLGRRVVATADGAIGGYAEWAIAGTEMVFDAPGSLSDREAAAFFFPFHLAHLTLFERARLLAGETVLVHAGAGGVGSATIQLAVDAGARVFATAGSPEKTEFCRELGAELAIDYRAGDFVDAILDATDGKGVDLVCDLVGGSVSEQSWRCIALHGRHFMVGFAGGIEAEDSGIPPRPICFGQFALSGVLLAYSHDPVGLKRATGFNLFPRSVGQDVHDHLIELLGEKRIHPVVGSVVPFDAVPEALETMEARKTIGRVVVEVEGEVQVEA